MRKLLAIFTVLCIGTVLSFNAYAYQDRQVDVGRITKDQTFTIYFESNLQCVGHAAQFIKVYSGYGYVTFKLDPSFYNFLNEDTVFLGGFGLSNGQGYLVKWLVVRKK